MNAKIFDPPIDFANLKDDIVDLFDAAAIKSIETIQNFTAYQMEF